MPATSSLDILYNTFYYIFNYYNIKPDIIYRSLLLTYSQIGTVHRKTV